MSVSKMRSCNFFWRRNEVHINEFAEALVKQHNLGAQPSIGAKFRIVFDDHLWPGCEHDLKGQLPNSTSKGECTTSGFTESWDLLLLDDVVPRIEFILLSVTGIGVGARREHWQKLHLEFCRKLLFSEKVDCIWNCFVSPVLWHDGVTANKYWSTEVYLQKALKNRLLFTDGRVKNGRPSAGEKKNIQSNFSSVLGYTDSGKIVLCVQDIPKSLSEVEEALK